jgi:ABC-2 type transport system ATP-binding protein
MGEPAVAIVGLVKRYGRRTVVDDLSLSVERGSILAILGPNGAGKTTTVETIGGFRRPDGGSLSVLGFDPSRDREALRSRVGVMLQEGGMYPLATPAEVVRLYAAFFREPLDPDELIDRVGLAAVRDARYRTLSGGEKQRLALAIALVGKPELLILDEPTAGMDPAARADTRRLIGELRAAGATVILTTHDLTDVDRLADRVAVIDHGRLVALGSPSELTASASPRLIVRLSTPLSRLDQDALAADLLAGSGRGSLAEDGGSGRYRLDGLAPTPGLVARLAAWCATRDVLIVELRAGTGSLEERYLELIADEAGEDAT